MLFNFFHNITLKLSKGSKDLLTEKGYDPTLGARPLKRAIQKIIEIPISDKIISGEVKSGDKIFTE